MAHKMNECGWFFDRDSDTLTIKQGNLTEKFLILKYFPFTSDRKASSVVVQNENGQIFVFVKGADSQIIKMSKDSNTEIVEMEAEKYAA